VQCFLTGEFGMYPLFYRDIPYRLEKLDSELGTRFSGADLGFKAYPCCAVIHSVLDAVLALGDATPDPATIEAVRVFGSPRMKIAAIPVELRKRPQCDVDCQFSIPWAVACALVDRRVSLGHFNGAALGDARYAALAPRVDVDMQDGREGVHAEITLKDGRVVRTPTIVIPKGHGDNPLSTAEVVERYRDCMRHAATPLSAARIAAVDALVMGLADLDDASALMRALAP